MREKLDKLPIEEHSHSPKLKKCAEKVNLLIDHYNASSSIEDKKQILMDLCVYRQYNIDKLPPVSDSMADLVLNEMFTVIQTGFKQLGLSDLSPSSIHSFTRKDVDKPSEKKYNELLAGKTEGWTFFFSTINFTEKTNKQLAKIKTLIGKIAIGDPEQRLLYLTLLKKKIQLLTIDKDLDTAKRLRELVALIACKIDDSKKDTAKIKAPDSYKQKFATILSNMSPKKLNEFANSVSQLTNKSEQKISPEMIFLGSLYDPEAGEKKRLHILNQLENLYAPGEEGKKEYDSLIRTCFFERLAQGNGVVFKITPNDGTSPFVLKIAKRLDVKKSKDEKVNYVLADVAAPVYSERTTSVAFDTPIFTSPSTSSVFITDYFSKGDIIKDKDKSIEGALKVYIQMANIVIKLEKNKLTFPDMKNSNWLIDDSGALKISDTKSFISSKKFQRTGGMMTFGFTPPEKLPGPGATHSYILGKNLNEFLLNSTEEVRSTPKASIMKDLAANLTSDHPENRLPVSDALGILECTQNRPGLAQPLMRALVLLKKAGILETDRKLLFGNKALITTLLPTLEELNKKNLLTYRKCFALLHNNNAWRDKQLRALFKVYQNSTIEFNSSPPTNNKQQVITKLIHTINKTDDIDALTVLYSNLIKQETDNPVLRKGRLVGSAMTVHWSKATSLIQEKALDLANKDPNLAENQEKYKQILDNEKHKITEGTKSFISELDKILAEKSTALSFKS